MGNVALAVLTWVGVLMHLAVGVAIYRRLTTIVLMPWLNLVVAFSVVIYWARKWYSYVVHDIVWHGTDQLLPAAELLVVLLSVFSITGRYSGVWPAWMVFIVHTVVITGAACFFSFVRFNRSM